MRTPASVFDRSTASVPRARFTWRRSRSRTSWIRMPVPASVASSGRPRPCRYDSEASSSASSCSGCTNARRGRVLLSLRRRPRENGQRENRQRPACLVTRAEVESVARHASTVHRPKQARAQRAARGCLLRHAPRLVARILAMPDRVSVVGNNETPLPPQRGRVFLRAQARSLHTSICRILGRHVHGALLGCAIAIAKAGGRRNQVRPRSNPVSAFPPVLPSTATPQQRGFWLVCRDFLDFGGVTVPAANIRNGQAVILR